MGIKYKKLTEEYFDPEQGDECSYVGNNILANDYTKVSHRGKISDYSMYSFRRPIKITKIDRSESNLKEGNWK